MKQLKILILLIFIPLLLNAPEFDYKQDIKFYTYFDYYKNRKAEMKTLEFSRALLVEYLQLKNIPNRNIILAQAILETGNFTSDIYIYNNNLFGMKLARIRPTTAIKSSRNHAVYRHWMCSVDDYSLWYTYMTRNKSYQNYHDFLADIGYAEDKYYISKLNIIHNNFLE